MKPHSRTLPIIDHQSPKSHTHPKTHILGRRRPTPSHTNPWTQEKSQNSLNKHIIKHHQTQIHTTFAIM